MITSLAAIAILSTQTSVEDYFPMRPGMVKVYEEQIVSNGKTYKFNVIETFVGTTTIKRAENYFDKEEPDEDKRDKVREFTEEAFEVRTAMDSDKPVPTYYQTKSNRVYIVGVEEGQLLKSVYPIFAVGSNPETFIYSGEIPVMGAPAPAFIDGETKPRGDYKFQNKNYSAVETKLNYKMQVGGGIDITSEQKSIYAKGIGLVEYEESGKAGSRTTKRKRKLTKIQFP
jgi:hypothetical protein